MVNVLRVPCGDFVSNLRALKFAYNKSVENPSFLNMFIRTKSKFLEMVATDGQRLAWTKLPIPQSCEFKAVAPFMNLVLSTRNFACDEEIEISVSNSTSMADGVKVDDSAQILKFQQKHIKTELQCPSEKFPNFDKVIHSCKFMRSCLLDAATIRAACSILHPLAGLGPAKVLFDAGSDGLDVSIPNVVKNLRIPFKNAIGEPLEISLPINAFCSACLSLPEADIQMSFSGEKSLVKVMTAEHIEFYFAPEN